MSTCETCDNYFAMLVEVQREASAHQREKIEYSERVCELEEDLEKSIEIKDRIASDLLAENSRLRHVLENIVGLMGEGLRYPEIASEAVRLAEDALGSSVRNVQPKTQAVPAGPEHSRQEYTVRKPTSEDVQALGREIAALRTALSGALAGASDWREHALKAMFPNAPADKQADLGALPGESANGAPSTASNPGGTVKGPAARAGSNLAAPPIEASQQVCPDSGDKDCPSCRQHPKCLEDAETCHCYSQGYQDGRDYKPPIISNTTTTGTLQNLKSIPNAQSEPGCEVVGCKSFGPHSTHTITGPAKQAKPESTE